jgi:hypothetical protein
LQKVREDCFETLSTGMSESVTQLNRLQLHLPRRNMRKPPVKCHQPAKRPSGQDWWVSNQDEVEGAYLRLRAFI